MDSGGMDDNWVPQGHSRLDYRKRIAELEAQLKQVDDNWGPQGHSRLDYRKRIAELEAQLKQLEAENAKLQAERDEIVPAAEHFLERWHFAPESSGEEEEAAELLEQAIKEADDE